MTEAAAEPRPEPKPAAEPPKPSTEVAVRDPELDRFARLGQWLAAAEGAKDPKGPAGMAAAYRIAAAADLGLSPMAAAELYVVDGKLRVTALLLRAIAEAHGYRVEPDKEETTAESCTAVLYRTITGLGGKSEREIGRSTFTLEDAERAGLLGKTNYQRYPARMLWARASTNVIRDYASAVAVGIVTEEELDEMQADAPVVEAEFSEEPTPQETPLDEAAQFEAEREMAAEAAAAADRDLAEAANAERAEDLGPPRAEGEA